MPHIDSRSGEVVIRIVYDGDPEAGKTTNIEKLNRQISLQRRGAAASPGTSGRRTEFFDWLDFAGGFLDGRRVRCQLVSVPGQAAVLHRRRYLLEKADAVVFVADSQPDSLASTAASLARTQEILTAVEGSVPVGVVLQANKQDVPGALGEFEVARALDPQRRMPVVAARAISGDGVMQTFLLAVRLATDRTRALAMGGAVDDLPAELSNPEALHQHMVSSEPQPATAPERAPEVLEEAQVLEKDEPGEPVAESVAWEEVDLASLEVPSAQEILAGNLWPPVRGRISLAMATAAGVAVAQTRQPWAPIDSVELTCADGWLLHTTPRWVYDGEAAAKLALMRIVRRQAALGEFVPENRALLVAPSSSGWRLWMLTRPAASPVEHVRRLVYKEGPQAHRAFLERVERGLRSLADLGVIEGGSVPGGAAGLEVTDASLGLLALPDGEVPTYPRARDVAALLKGAAREGEATQ